MSKKILIRITGKDGYKVFKLEMQKDYLDKNYHSFEKCISDELVREKNNLIQFKVTDEKNNMIYFYQADLNEKVYSLLIGRVNEIVRTARVMMSLY